MIPAGERFEKIREIQNGGDVRWEGRRLRCVDETIAAGLTREALARLCLVPDAPEIPIPDAAPGDVVRFAIRFTAPIVPATCVSIRAMINAEGRPKPGGRAKENWETMHGGGAHMFRETKRPYSPYRARLP